MVGTTTSILQVRKSRLRLQKDLAQSPPFRKTELASDWSISFFKDCTVSTTSWNNIYNRGDPLVDHEMNLADGTTTEEQINFGI